MKKIIRMILIMFFIFLIVFIFNRIAKILARQYFKLENSKVIEHYSEIYDVDPYLVCAIIHTESKFKQYAVSSKGASGYMQLMEKTAEWGASEIGIDNYSFDKIFEADINIQIGVWYINSLSRQFKNIDVVIASYNGGSGNVTKWLNDEKYSLDNESLYEIPFEETKEYVERVNFAYKVYKTLYKGAF